jgi:N-acetylmuramoyl-L-alanine amidase
MLKKCIAILLSTSCIALTSYSSDTATTTNNTEVKKQQSLLKTIVIDAGHGLPNSNAEGRYSYESAITLDVALKLGARLKQVLPDCNILYTRTDENLPAGLKDLNKANRYRAQFANDNHGDLFISIHVNSMEQRYQKKIEGYREENYTVTVGKGKKKKKVQKTRTVPIYKSYKLPCSNTGTETYIWAIDKYDEKQKSVGSRDDESGFFDDDSAMMNSESPEVKILASLRTKKYFNQSLSIANLVEEEFKKTGRVSQGVKQRNNQGIWVLQATNMPSILVETGFICNPDDEDYLNSEKGQNELTYAMMRAVLRYKAALDGGSEVDVASTPSK